MGRIIICTRTLRPNAIFTQGSVGTDAEAKSDSGVEMDIQRLNPLTDSDYFEEVGVLILHNK